MKPKHIIILAIIAIACIIVVSLFTGFVSVNDGQNWVYLQYVNGTVRIVEEPGMYMKAFGKTRVYPRFIEFRYNDDPDDGDKSKESIEVTYNDGGMADVSTYIRLATPSLKENRIKFHQQFGGNKDNIKASTKSYMIDCLKSTAPLMSSSENQSARKAEFKQVVEGQLKKGTFKMRKEQIVRKDVTDKTGEGITIFKTEIVNDKDGMPIVVTSSPITEDFGMTVVQFSVTATNYDPDTKKQFSAKKASFLLTEQAKADREKETQERLMVVERGLREKAEETAKANVLKAKAVIAAELKAEVALQTKLQAETAAAMQLSVAKINKAELLMIASAKLEVAQIKAKEAEQEKIAAILRAEGRKEAIELSGDITELEEAVIAAEVNKAAAVAEAMAKMRGPEVVIFGSKSEGGGGNDITQALFQLRLMQDAGLIKKVNVDSSKVQRKVR